MSGSIATLAIAMSLTSGGGFQNASAAIPTARLPQVNPEHSMTGWTLAALVMMQRDEIAGANLALSHVLQLSTQDQSEPGYATRDQAMQRAALRFAAMAGHEADAVRLAHDLIHPKASPPQATETASGGEADIATLILVQDAFARKEWNTVHHLLTLTPHHGPLVALAAPVLMAWSLSAQGHTRQALDLLGMASARSSTHRLYLLHAAMIAESLPASPLPGQLYRQAGNASGDPLTLQILYAQRYGSWLARRGQKDIARDVVAALGVTSPLAALVIGPLQQALPTIAPPNPSTGAAILNLQLALILTDVAQQDHIPHDPAIIALQQALFLDPNLSIARIFLADTLREINQMPAGLATLDRINPSDPLAALAAQERVNLTTRTGDLGQQADALHKALALVPDNPEFLTQLAEVEDQRGHHADAISLYTRALKASSPRKDTLWPILLGRAMAAEQDGNWPMVQEDMAHALELAPEQPEVLNFVGYASIEHDLDQAKALTLLKKAVEIDPSNSAIQDSYAWALLKYRGDLHTAFHLLVQAAEHSPNDPEIGYHLGVAYWYLGRHTEAQDQWNQSLDDSPQPRDRTLITQALQNGGPHLTSFEGASPPSPPQPPAPQAPSHK